MFEKQNLTLKARWKGVLKLLNKQTNAIYFLKVTKWWDRYNTDKWVLYDIKISLELFIVK